MPRTFELTIKHLQSNREEPNPYFEAIGDERKISSKLLIVIVIAIVTHYFVSTPSVYEYTPHVMNPHNIFGDIFAKPIIGFFIYLFYLCKYFGQTKR